MKQVILASTIAATVLMGCASGQYTPPEESGLIGVRPFPNAGDVCVVIGENDLTNQYLDDSATLIGCPTHEGGAIADRVAQGAIRLDTVGKWVLFSVPD